VQVESSCSDNRDLDRYLVTTYLDGQTVLLYAATSSGVDTVLPGNFTIDVSTWPEGSYALYRYCVDEVGNPAADQPLFWFNVVP
jgi:hypothetical protein